MRPVIGITVSLDPGERLRAGSDYAYLKRSYGRAVAAAGGSPVLLSPDLGVEAAVALCDGLVISGGDDLPAQASPDGGLGPPAAAGLRPEQPERVAWERALLDAARAAERPLLGVCYGMQLLNLHRGGTLCESFASPVDHGGDGRFTEHEIRRRGPHPGLAALPDPAMVSSSHRQRVDRVAPGLAVLAEAPDGVVEALGDDHCLGVEWHPEQDETGRCVYAWLVTRARGRSG